MKKKYVKGTTKRNRINVGFNDEEYELLTNICLSKGLPIATYSRLIILENLAKEEVTNNGK